MDELIHKGDLAKKAAQTLAHWDCSAKNRTLQRIGDDLSFRSQYILEENQKDLDAATVAGVGKAVLDRLTLNPKRVQEMVEGVYALIALPDPVGDILAAWETTAGLYIRKVRVPLGVVGIIYEARPNVTVDATALCFKAGNAVILRGSSIARYSNLALVQVIRDALEATQAPVDAVQIMEDLSRTTVDRFLKLNGYLDVVIPRGGVELIKFAVANATVPVLETGAGNCHVYIDRSADFEMACRIVINAKTQRPAVCNAVETLLVEKEWAGRHLSALLERLREKGVECRGCASTVAMVPWVKTAVEQDWETEFLDLILAVKIVSGVEEAVSHINRYGTRHSEAILTEDNQTAQRFMQGVDAAALYHNASTRFTDGFMFGFGAEIGISTQKLHARGPVGLPELTTYKYLISGSGQIRT